MPKSHGDDDLVVDRYLLAFGSQIRSVAKELEDVDLIPVSHPNQHAPASTVPKVSAKSKRAQAALLAGASSTVDSLKRHQSLTTGGLEALDASKRADAQAAASGEGAAVPAKSHAEMLAAAAEEHAAAQAAADAVPAETLHEAAAVVQSTARGDDVAAHVAALQHQAGLQVADGLLRDAIDSHRAVLQATDAKKAEFKGARGLSLQALASLSSEIGATAAAARFQAQGEAEQSGKAASVPASVESLVSRALSGEPIPVAAVAAPAPAHATAAPAKAAAPQPTLIVHPVDAMVLAASRGDFTLVQARLDQQRGKGSKPVPLARQHSVTGMTLLMCAAAHGHQAMLQRLLQVKAVRSGIAVRDARGADALWYAVAYGQRACANALLAKGAPWTVVKGAALEGKTPAIPAKVAAVVKAALQAAKGNEAKARLAEPEPAPAPTPAPAPAPKPVPSPVPATSPAVTRAPSEAAAKLQALLRR